MDDREKWAGELRSTLNECFDQIRYARAAELARSRRYLEAEGLLAPNGHAPSNPKELDLLARIAAQQGRFDQARRLWEAAFRLSPNNSDYERAIQCAEAAERSQQKRRKVVMIVLAVLTVASLVLAAYLLFRASRSATQQKPSAEEKLSSGAKQQPQQAPRPNTQPSPTKQTPPSGVPPKR